MSWHEALTSKSLRGKNGLLLYMSKVAEEGLETLSATGLQHMKLRLSRQTVGAEYGAVGASDAKVQEIIASLPHLPPEALEIMLSTVRAFRGTG